MFKIDKGVPSPQPIPVALQQLKAHLPGHSYRLYPFLAMVPGDSFFVPGGTVSGKHAQTARNTGKALGLKFITRAVDGGVRIWRLW